MLGARVVLDSSVPYFPFNSPYAPRLRPHNFLCILHSSTDRLND